MKTNIIETIRKNWPAIIATAVRADVFDEILLPGILLTTGHPVLSGLIIIGDLDWLTYPIIFFTLRIATKLITEVGA